MVGECVGAFVGDAVGESVGMCVGAIVGIAVGTSVGCIDGAAVGFIVGAAVGCTDGAAVGVLVAKHLVLSLGSVTYPSRHEHTNLPAMPSDSASSHRVVVRSQPCDPSSHA